jgi:hypothetical protein
MTFLPGFPSETLLKTPYFIIGQLEKVKNYQQNQWDSQGQQVPW